MWKWRLKEDCHDLLVIWKQCSLSLCKTTATTAKTSLLKSIRVSKFSWSWMLTDIMDACKFEKEIIACSVFTSFFQLEAPKWDHNLQFTPISEMLGITVCFCVVFPSRDIFYVSDRKCFYIEPWIIFLGIMCSRSGCLTVWIIASCFLLKIIFRE